MSDAMPIAPAPVAPTNGAHPTTPQKAAIKPVPVAPAVAAEVDDSEEYVVDGKTTRLNKEQRKLHFQKALAADKRMKEAADKEAQANDLIRLYEEDPEAAMVKQGKDPSKIFASHLEKKAKLELMTEEQRNAQSLKDRAEAAEAKVKATEEEKKKAYQEHIDRQNFLALEKQLIGAADKAGLDGAPEVLDGLCDIALEFLEYGITISADQCAQEYLRREREHLEAKDKKLHSVLKGKKLLAYLGDATLAEIKSALAAVDAESLKSIPAPQAKTKTQVKAHERTIKGAHINELAFDKKFGL